MTKNIFTGSGKENNFSFGFNILNNKNIKKNNILIYIIRQINQIIVLYYINFIFNFLLIIVKINFF